MIIKYNITPDPIPDRSVKIPINPNMFILKKL